MEDSVSDRTHCTQGNETNFVVTLERASELTDQSDEQQFTNLRQFGIDDGNESCKHRRER